MQIQELSRLAAFKASRPFALSVGRCARIAGDSRPFLVTEWTGPEFEVSCLAGDSLDISTRPVNEVSLIEAKGAMCGACRYDRTPCRIARAAA